MATPGYVRDVQSLVEAYGKDESAQSFSEFRELWKSLSFTFIHQGRPKEIDPRNYTQMLYATALEFLSGSKPLSVRLGALYALYTLYKTQDCRPETLIYLSKANIAHVVELLRQIKERQLGDAFHVMHTLVQSNLFVYGLVASNASEAMDIGLQLEEEAKLKVERARKLLLHPDTIRAHFRDSILDCIPLESVERASAEYEAAQEAVEGSGVVTRPTFEDALRERVLLWDTERTAMLGPMVYKLGPMVDK